MKVLKKFNNNVVMSINDFGEEIVLIGNGLGFSVSPGDEIDKKKIEKTFVLDGNYTPESIVNLLNSIPQEQLDISKKIIAMAEKELAVKMNDFVYLSLSDHLHYAYKRLKQGVINQNPLLNELKIIYTREFEIALKALKIIKDQTGKELPEEEAGFITLHLVNAQQGQTTINETMRVPKMIKEILKIIEFHFSIELDTSTLSYSRFLTHLKYFVNRSLEGNMENTSKVDVNQTEKMLKSFKENFPKIFDCIDKIIDYMSSIYGITVKEEERFYLFVYLHKLTIE